MEDMIFAVPLCLRRAGYISSFAKLLNPERLVVFIVVSIVFVDNHWA
jgi:hypothetical protein